MNYSRTQIHGFGESPSQFAVKMGNRFTSDNSLLTPSIGAVKIPHTVTSEKIDKRLREEIRAMASFSHPNLIRLLAHDPAPQPRWFIMEYYPKGTLDDNKESFRGNSLLALEALRPIIEGVSQLHCHDPVHVHRDIKPKNIFVSNNGQLVLGDFGIVFTKADDRTRLTKPGEAPYSRDWIPDWVRFRTLEEFSPKVDVYMLAKVLNFMLANNNVLPSHLDDPAFDLRRMFPNAEGIDLVYDLLSSCIVSRERDCQPENAGELLSRIDEVISKIKGKSSGLLFSFISTHSMTGPALPVKRSYYIESFADIQVYLPTRGNAFIAKARILGSGDDSAAEIGFSLGGEETKTVRVGASQKYPGTWSEEIHLQTSKPLERGWHSLRVDGFFVGQLSYMTGFMLYSV